MIKKCNFVFFGTSFFSVTILDELSKANFFPNVVVTMPDRPKGRNLKLTPTPVKLWAIEKKIKILEPQKLDQDFFDKLQSVVPSLDFSVVASYGYIIPKKILDLPKFGTLNVHPSLLPRMRGATPVHTTILEGVKSTGVTIILMDEKMDHGPIVAVRNYEILDKDITEPELEKTLAKMGGELLVQVIPDLLSGKVRIVPQDDLLATFTKKILKRDGELDLTQDDYLNYRKFRAFIGGVGTYFFTESEGKKIRVKIKSAKFMNGRMIVEIVLPENEKEMTFSDFKNRYGIKNS